MALARAAVEHPDDTVRRALFPVVGESTLRDLVREAKANEAAFRARVRAVLRSSYSGHYRRMVPRLLGALDLRCNNTPFRPVMDAVDLLRRYAGRERVRWYEDTERVPLDGVVPAAWRTGSSMIAVASSASRTSCACWPSCVTRSAVVRCRSSVRAVGMQRVLQGPADRR